MQVQKFENEKVIAYVHYSNMPTKKDLQEACVIFMKKAIQEIEERKNDSNKGISETERERTIL